MTGDLDREHTQLLEFLYACPLGLIQADLDGTMTMLNPVAMQLLMPLGPAGRAMNLFRTFADVAPDLQALVAGFEPARGQICQGRRIFIGHRGSRVLARPQVLSCTIVKLGETRFMATLEDVSELVAQERRLRQADMWFASLIDESEGFAVIGLNSDGIIETVNASARQQTRFDDADLVGQPLTKLDCCDPASSALSVTDEIDLARRDGWHLSEVWSARRDAPRVRCQRLISVRSDEQSGSERQVTGFTVVLRPVASSHIGTDELRRRLTKDHLTGVCNRAHFFDVAELERRHCVHAGRDLGLVTLDIDHFKRVNDTYGHAVGDLVLQAVATACASALQTGDTFARLGGEEFVALLPGRDAMSTLRCAEAMRTALAGLAVATSGTELHPTASFGCAVRLDDDSSVEQILARADAALYRAKRSGRDRVEIDWPVRDVA